MFVRQRTLWRIIKKKEKSIAIFELFMSYLYLYSVIVLSYEEYIGEMKFTRSSIKQLIVVVLEMLITIKYAISSKFDMKGDIFLAFGKYKYLFNIVYSIWFTWLLYYRFMIIMKERQQKLHFIWLFKSFNKGKGKIILSEYCLNKSLFRKFKTLAVAVLCMAEITYQYLNISALIIFFTLIFEFNRLEGITFLDCIITNFFIVLWFLQLLFCIGSLIYGLFYLLIVNEFFVFRTKYINMKLESLLRRKTSDKTMLKVLKSFDKVLVDIFKYSETLKYMLFLIYTFFPIIHFLTFTGFITTNSIGKLWKFCAVISFSLCLIVNLSFARIYEKVHRTLVRIKIIYFAIKYSVNSQHGIFTHSHFVNHLDGIQKERFCFVILNKETKLFYL